MLAEAIDIARPWGYDEINLNCVLGSVGISG